MKKSRHTESEIFQVLKEAETGYRSFAKAKRSILSYLSGYYSVVRPHQHNGGLPPNKTEEIYWTSSKSAAKIT